MLLVGVLVATPLTVLPFYPDDIIYMLSFLIPAGGSMILGAILCLFGRQDGDGGLEWRSSIQRSGLTVLFAWFWGIFVGAIPFVIGKQLTILQALFESVSGWTTTGLSVMDVTVTPKIFLFHRSFMQYCLLIAGTAAYRIAGMELFDAIMHTMCALSTGGFSTRLNSIGEYNSFFIEIITIFLMLAGTTNFAALLLLAKRKWRQFTGISEIRFMFLLLLIFVPLTAISLSHGLGISLAQGLRKASFDIVSALSTTGYSTMSYTSWPPVAIGILILMMLIGGGMGSTAGGLKLSRVYIMLRLAVLEIRKRLSPTRNVEAPVYVKAQGKTPIDSSLAADTTGFAVCYMGLFITGSLLTTVTAGCGLTEGMFEFASALGTVGLSIGITGPLTGAGTLIVEMFGMVLGRLEIFLVIIGFYSGVNILRQSFNRKL